MKFIFVESVDDVIQAALEGPAKDSHAKSNGSKSRKKATPKKAKANGKGTSR
jgi:hypothetical protein